MKQTPKFFISVFTLTAFLATQLLPFPQAFASVFPAEVKTSKSFQLEIPQDLATLEDIQAGTGPAILHIQTAHGNYEAQKKIQALLHYLKDKYGFKTLFVEGSPFKLEPEALRFFPNHSDLTLAVNEDLTHKALVKGPELFLIEDKDAEAYGIENLDTYKANGEAFKAVLTQQQKTENFSRDMNMQIDRLSAALMSKNLRSFLGRVESYESGRTSFLDWMNELKEEAAKTLNLEADKVSNQLDWPMLVRLFKLQEIEKKLDQSAFSREKDRFIKDIRRFMGTPERRQIHAQLAALLSQPLSQQHLPDPETGVLFEHMVEALPQNFNYRAYPNVNLFIGHLILQSEIKGDLLLAETDRLAGQIAEALVTTPEEKQLLAVLKNYQLLKKLFVLELTPGDYAVISNREAVRNPVAAGSLVAKDAPRDDIRPSEMAKAFLALNKSKRVRDLKFGHLNDLDSLFDTSLEFYRLVKKRDVEMTENVVKRLKETGSDKAVVITGGFHSHPFKEFFTKQGFSYALLSPHITTEGGEAERKAYVGSILENTPVIKSTYESATLALNRNELRQLRSEDWTVAQIKGSLGVAASEMAKPAVQRDFESSLFAREWPEVSGRAEARTEDETAPNPVWVWAKGDQRLVSLLTGFEKLSAGALTILSQRAAALRKDLESSLRVDDVVKDGTGWYLKRKVNSRALAAVERFLEANRPRAEARASVWIQAGRPDDAVKSAALSQMPDEKDTAARDFFLRYSAELRRGGASEVEIASPDSPFEFSADSIYNPSYALLKIPGSSYFAFAFQDIKFEINHFSETNHFLGANHFWGLVIYEEPGEASYIPRPVMFYSDEIRRIQYDDQAQTFRIEIEPESFRKIAEEAAYDQSRASRPVEMRHKLHFALAASPGGVKRYVELVEAPAARPEARGKKEDAIARLDLAIRRIDENNGPNWRERLIAAGDIVRVGIADQNDRAKSVLAFAKREVEKLKEEDVPTTDEQWSALFSQSPWHSNLAGLALQHFKFDGETLGGNRSEARTQRKRLAPPKRLPAISSIRKGDIAQALQFVEESTLGGEERRRVLEYLGRASKAFQNVKDKTHPTSEEAIVISRELSTAKSFLPSAYQASIELARQAILDAVSHWKKLASDSSAEIEPLDDEAVSGQETLNLPEEVPEKTGIAKRGRRPRNQSSEARVVIGPDEIRAAAQKITVADFLNRKGFSPNGEIEVELRNGARKTGRIQDVGDFSLLRVESITLNFPAARSEARSEGTAPINLWDTPDAGEYYARFASSPAYRNANEHLIQLAGAKGYVVDLGSGTGSGSELLRQSGADLVIGIDDSQVMLNKAKATVGFSEAGSPSRIGFVKGRAQDLNTLVPGNSDAVYSFNAIHLMGDYPELFAAIYKNLAPGGKLAFNTTFFKSLAADLELPAAIIRSLNQRYTGVELRGFGRRPKIASYKVEDYVAWVKAAGFTDVHTEIQPVELTKENLLDFFSIPGVADGLFPQGMPQHAKMEIMREAIQSLDAETITRNWLYVVATKPKSEARSAELVREIQGLAQDAGNFSNLQYHLRRAGIKVGLAAMAGATEELEQALNLVPDKNGTLARTLIALIGKVRPPAEDPTTELKKRQEAAMALVNQLDAANAALEPYASLQGWLGVTVRQMRSILTGAATKARERQTGLVTDSLLAIEVLSRTLGIAPFPYSQAIDAARKLLGLPAERSEVRTEAGEVFSEATLLEVDGIFQIGEGPAIQADLAGHLKNLSPGTYRILGIMRTGKVMFEQIDPVTLQTISVGKVFMPFSTPRSALAKPYVKYFAKGTYAPRAEARSESEPPLFERWDGSQIDLSKAGFDENLLGEVGRIWRVGMLSGYEGYQVEAYFDRLIRQNRAQVEAFVKQSWNSPARTLLEKQLAYKFLSRDRAKTLEEDVEAKRAAFLKDFGSIAIYSPNLNRGHFGYKLESEGGSAYLHYFLQAVEQGHAVHYFFDTSNRHLSFDLSAESFLQLYKPEAIKDEKEKSVSRRQFFKKRLAFYDLVQLLDDKGWLIEGNNRTTGIMGALDRYALAKGEWDYIYLTESGFQEKLRIAFDVIGDRSRRLAQNDWAVNQGQVKNLTPGELAQMRLLAAQAGLDLTPHNQNLERAIRSEARYVEQFDLRKTAPELAEIVRQEIEHQNNRFSLVASQNEPPAWLLFLLLFPFSRYITQTFLQSAEQRYAQVFEHSENYAVIATPHSGSHANQALDLAFLKPGDKIMALYLTHGGHLSHGMNLNVSGRLHQIVPVFVGADGKIDYDAFEKQALTELPDKIIIGASAYPGDWDIVRVDSIRRKVEKLRSGKKVFLHFDAAHVADLISAGLHNSPFGYADAVTVLTHMSGGAKGAVLFVKKEYEAQVRAAVTPGIQEEAFGNAVAAKAAHAKEMASPEYKEYAKRITLLRDAVVDEARKLKIPMSMEVGSENHEILFNIYGTAAYAKFFEGESYNLFGSDAQVILDQLGIEVNGNTGPVDEEAERLLPKHKKQSPVRGKFMRIGFRQLAQRGMTQDDARELLRIIHEALLRAKPEVIRTPKSDAVVITVQWRLPEEDKAAVRARLQILLNRYPMRDAAKFAALLEGNIKPVWQDLQARDPELAILALDQLKTQSERLQALPTGGEVFPEVTAVAASALGIPYSEGPLGANYYPGHRVLDQSEGFAAKSWEKLLGLTSTDVVVNVQPHTHAQALEAALVAAADPRQNETASPVIFLTSERDYYASHGRSENFSSQFFNSHVVALPELQNEGELKSYLSRFPAPQGKKQVIVFDPSLINAATLRQAAGPEAVLIADLGTATLPAVYGEELSGLSSRDLLKHADMAIYDTRSAQGFPGGIIAVRKALAGKLQTAILPGTSGGRFHHMIASKSVLAGILDSERGKSLFAQLQINLTALAAGFSEKGFETQIAPSKTWISVKLPQGVTRAEIEARLAKLGIDLADDAFVAERNPGEIDLGVAGLTLLGFKEADVRRFAEMITGVIQKTTSQEVLVGQIRALAAEHPLHQELLDALASGRAEARIRNRGEGARPNEVRINIAKKHQVLIPLGVRQDGEKLYSVLTYLGPKKAGAEFEIFYPNQEFDARLVAGGRTQSELVSPNAYRFIIVLKPGDFLSFIPRSGFWTNQKLPAEVSKPVTVQVYVAKSPNKGDVSLVANPSSAIEINSADDVLGQLKLDSGPSSPVVQPGNFGFISPTLNRIAGPTGDWVLDTLSGKYVPDRAEARGADEMTGPEEAIFENALDEVSRRSESRGLGIDAPVLDNAAAIKDRLQQKLTQLGIEGTWKVSLNFAPLDGDTLLRAKFGDDRALILIDDKQFVIYDIGHPSVGVETGTQYFSSPYSGGVLLSSEAQRALRSGRESDLRFALAGNFLIVESPTSDKNKSRLEVYDLSPATGFRPVHFQIDQADVAAPLLDAYSGYGAESGILKAHSFYVRPGSVQVDQTNNTLSAEILQLGLRTYDFTNGNRRSESRVLTKKFDEPLYFSPGGSTEVLFTVHGKQHETISGLFTLHVEAVRIAPDKITGKASGGNLERTEKGFKVSGLRQGAALTIITPSGEAKIAVTKVLGRRISFYLDAPAYRAHAQNPESGGAESGAPATHPLDVLIAQIEGSRKGSVRVNVNGLKRFYHFGESQIFTEQVGKIELFRRIVINQVSYGDPGVVRSRRLLQALKSKIRSESRAVLLSEIREGFELETPDLVNLMRDYQEQVKRAKEKQEGTTLSWIKSFVKSVSGNETGTVLALDFGGSNFRVLGLELQGEGKVREIASRETRVPLSAMSGKAEGLFDYLAGQIEIFLKENKITGPLKIGFTYSYASELTDLKTAIATGLSKNLTSPDLVGKNIGLMLEVALHKKSIDNITVEAIANDTIGTGVKAQYSYAGMPREPGARPVRVLLGGILGTGNNFGFVDPETGIWINLESGNFDSALLRKTDWDLSLDGKTSNRGQHIKEKMVAGLYLGPLLQEVLKDVYHHGIIPPHEVKARIFEETGIHYFLNKAGDSGLIPVALFFAGLTQWVLNWVFIPLTQGLLNLLLSPLRFVFNFGKLDFGKIDWFKPYELQTADMQKISDDDPATMAGTREVFRKWGINDPSPIDMANVRTIANQIATRAARLTAMEIMALILMHDPELKEEVEYAVPIDGSVFEHYDFIRKQMEVALHDLAGELFAGDRSRADKIKLVLMKDGSGIGAGIIGGTARAESRSANSEFFIPEFRLRAEADQTQTLAGFLAKGIHGTEGLVLQVERVAGGIAEINPASASNLKLSEIKSVRGVLKSTRFGDLIASARQETRASEADIDKGVRYFKGEIVTAPVNTRFRPSRRSDFVYIPEMPQEKRLHYMRLAIESISRGEWMFAVAAAGASSRMSIKDAPEEVRRMAEEIFGQGHQLDSKAAVPIGRDSKGDAYTFLGLLLKNIARLEEQVGAAVPGSKKNGVLIMTNRQYQSELDLELAQRKFYGLEESQFVHHEGRLGFQQDLGAVYVANRADTKKLYEGLLAKANSDADRQKINLAYQAALEESDRVASEIARGNHEAVIYPGEADPLGHGEFFHQMVSKGVLLDLIDKGVKAISFRNIDNAAALYAEDWLVAAGMFLEQGLDMQPEVSLRVKGQKGGGLILTESGNHQLAEDPAFGASFEAMVKDLQKKGLTRQVTDKGLVTDEVMAGLVAHLQSGNTLQLEPSPVSFEPETITSAEQLKALNADKKLAAFSDESGTVHLFRIVTSMDSEGFNDAVADFTPGYIMDLYRTPGQSREEFIEEMRRARAAGTLEAIAERGRAKFPALVDPKPSSKGAAAKAKTETNMWQSTGVVPPETKVKAVGVQGIANIDQAAYDRADSTDRLSLVKNLRMLATKSWGDPVESYSANKKFIQPLMTLALDKPLFPPDLMTRQEARTEQDRVIAEIGSGKTVTAQAGQGTYQLLLQAVSLREFAEQSGGNIEVRIRNRVPNGVESFVINSQGKTSYRVYNLDDVTPAGYFVPPSELTYDVEGLRYIQEAFTKHPDEKWIYVHMGVDWGTHVLVNRSGRMFFVNVKPVRNIAVPGPWDTIASYESIPWLDQIPEVLRFTGLSEARTNEAVGIRRSEARVWGWMAAGVIAAPVIGFLGYHAVLALLKYRRELEAQRKEVQRKRAAYPKALSYLEKNAKNIVESEYLNPAIAEWIPQPLTVPFQYIYRSTDWHNVPDTLLAQMEERIDRSEDFTVVFSVGFNAAGNYVHYYDPGHFKYNGLGWDTLIVINHHDAFGAELTGGFQLRSEARTAQSDLSAATDRLRLREKEVVGSILSRIFSRLPRKGNGRLHRMLDLGAGDGALTLRAARDLSGGLLFDEVYAADKDGRRIDQFRRSHSFRGLSLFETDFTDLVRQLRQNNEKFEAILMAFSILYVPFAERNQFLKDVAKILREKGLMVFALNGTEVRPGNQVDIRNRLMRRHKLTTTGADTNIDRFLLDMGLRVESKPIRIVHTTTSRREMVNIVLALLPADDRNFDSASEYVDQFLEAPVPQGVEARRFYRLEIDLELLLVSRLPLSEILQPEINEVEAARKDNKSEARAVEIARQELVEKLTAYDDQLSEADDLSERKPDVFLLLGNPDAQTFASFARIWREQYAGKPIMLAGGGEGRGKRPLITAVMNLYKDKLKLEEFAEERRQLQAFGTNPSFHETDVLAILLKLEGIDKQFIYREKTEVVERGVEKTKVRVGSNNTRENFTRTEEPLAALFAEKEIKEPVIALVTKPSLLLRVQATGEEVWKKWNLKRLATGRPDLNSYNTRKLLEHAFYIARFTKKIHEEHPGLPSWEQQNELKGYYDIKQVPEGLRDYSRLIAAQGALEKYIEELHLHYLAELKGQNAAAALEGLVEMGSAVQVSRVLQPILDSKVDFNVKVDALGKILRPIGKDALPYLKTGFARVPDYALAVATSLESEVVTLLAPDIIPFLAANVPAERQTLAVALLERVPSEAAESAVPDLLRLALRLDLPSDARNLALRQDGGLAARALHILIKGLSQVPSRRREVVEAALGILGGQQLGRSEGEAALILLRNTPMNNSERQLAVSAVLSAGIKNFNLAELALNTLATIGIQAIPPGVSNAGVVAGVVGGMEEAAGLAAREEGKRTTRQESRAMLRDEIAGLQPVLTANIADLLDDLSEHDFMENRRGRGELYPKEYVFSLDYEGRMQIFETGGDEAWQDILSHKDKNAFLKVSTNRLINLNSIKIRFGFDVPYVGTTALEKRESREKFAALLAQRIITFFNALAFSSGSPNFSSVGRLDSSVATGNPTRPGEKRFTAYSFVVDSLPGKLEILKDLDVPIRVSWRDSAGAIQLRSGKIVSLGADQLELENWSQPILFDSIITSAPAPRAEARTESLTPVPASQLAAQIDQVIAQKYPPYVPGEPRQVYFFFLYPEREMAQLIPAPGAHNYETSGWPVVESSRIGVNVVTLLKARPQWKEGALYTVRAVTEHSISIRQLPPDENVAPEENARSESRAVKAGLAEASSLFDKTTKGIGSLPAAVSLSGNQASVSSQGPQSGLGSITASVTPAVIRVNREYRFGIFSLAVLNSILVAFARLSPSDIAAALGQIRKIFGLAETPAFARSESRLIEPSRFEAAFGTQGAVRRADQAPLLTGDAGYAVYGADLAKQLADPETLFILLDALDKSGAKAPKIFLAANQVEFLSSIKPRLLNQKSGLAGIERTEILRLLHRVEAGELLGFIDPAGINAFIATHQKEGVAVLSLDPSKAAEGALNLFVKGVERMSTKDKRVLLSSLGLSGSEAAALLKKQAGDRTQNVLASLLRKILSDTPVRATAGGFEISAGEYVGNLLRAALYTARMA